MQDPRISPISIDIQRAAGIARFGWADGHETTYDAITLRWLCPCAYCRGEAGMPGWLDSNPTLTPAQVTLTDVALVGTYAIQCTWGDGHASGFHTFMLLREMCPCATCVADRERRHADHAAGTASPEAARHWHGGSGQ